MEQSLEEFGFDITPPDKLPPPPLGESSLKLNIAGVGKLLERARTAKTGAKHSFLQGRARLIENEAQVVYTIG